MNVGKMKMQEIYDTVVEHLLKQGKPATETGSPYGSCAYRGEGGTKCAVGVLLDDKDYNVAIEGAGVQQERVYKRLGLRERNGKKIELLRALQNVHDDSDATWDIPDWPQDHEAKGISKRGKERLRTVAAEFNLKQHKDLKA